MLQHVDPRRSPSHIGTFLEHFRRQQRWVERAAASKVLRGHGGDEPILVEADHVRDGGRRLTCCCYARSVVDMECWCYSERI